MHFILVLAELLNPGLPGSGMGPDSQEPFAGLTLIVHESANLTSETHLHAPEQPMGVESEGIDQNVIEKNNQENDDDRTDIQASQPGWRDQPADGPEHGLGQTVEESGDLVH